MEGRYLNEMMGLGFGGMEVGPIGFNATSDEEDEFNLGIRAALSNINTFR